MRRPGHGDPIALKSIEWGYRAGAAAGTSSADGPVADAQERSLRGVPRTSGGGRVSSRRIPAWMPDHPGSDANPERAAGGVPRTIAPAMSAGALRKVQVKFGSSMSAHRVHQAMT